MDFNIVQPTQPVTPNAQASVTQPTESTSGTPSSKTKYILLAALILLILVVVGGAYYLGVSRQQSAPSKNNSATATTVTPTATPISTAQPTPTPTNDPTKVVNDFYSTYVNCLQKYFDAVSKGTSPAPTSCPSLNTYPALSPDLISKLNQVKGADPILCAQNYPNNIKVDNAVSSGNTASTTVHTYYTGSGDNPIQVGLTLENNNWLITSITCTNGVE